MNLSAILQILGSGLSIVSNWLGYKNSTVELKAATAKAYDKDDQRNTIIVEKAIETGDVSSLSK